MLLAAIVSAIAVICITATQLTERNTAQRVLTIVASSLLEIDRLVANTWPLIEAAASNREPIPLDGFPLGLQLDPDGVAQGPERVADEIAAATAALVYEDGLDVFADTPQAFRLISRGAAVDVTLGRLTHGGHGLATAALIVSGTLALLLALAASAQARGPARFGAPALAIGFGAAIVWLVAVLAQSSFEGRAAGAVDSFSADLWWIAADALGMLVRNAAIVGAASAIVVAAAAAALVWLNRVERGGEFPDQRSEW